MSRLGPRRISSDDAPQPAVTIPTTVTALNSYTSVTGPIIAGSLWRATDNVRGIWTGNGAVSYPLGPFVNVKDFGAVGDGVTDDTIAILAAIASLHADYGGVVFFPPGDYLTSGQILVSAKKWITLMGCGQSLNVAGTNVGTRIRKTGAAAEPVIKVQTSPRFCIRDMVLAHDGVAVAGQHGLEVGSDGSAYGVNFIAERVSIFSTYDGIKSTNDLTSVELRALYIRSVVNDGIANTSTWSAVKADTIYISAPGRHGLNLTAGNSTFIDVITEQTGGDGIKGTYTGCTFVTPYAGDSVGQKGFNWLNSHNNTTIGGSVSAGAGGGAHSLFYLDGCYGNEFRNIDAAGASRYMVEVANTAAVPADQLLPNIFSFRSGGSSAQLGFTNDTAGYVALERSSISPKDSTYTFAHNVMATQAIADHWSWKARALSVANYALAADLAPGASPGPDPLDRWTFFNHMLGGKMQATTFALMGRNASNLIGVLPSTEVLGAGLITGDASTFTAGVGAWAATNGAFTAVGGLGHFVATGAGNGRILLNVAGLDTQKLYRLRFNLQQISPMAGTVRAYVRDNGGSGDDLKYCAFNATAANISAYQVAEFIPETTSVDIIVSIEGAGANDTFDVDNFTLNEVTCPGELLLTGARRYGAGDGGGGGLGLYGNTHATKPNTAELAGKLAHIPSATQVVDAAGDTISPNAYLVVVSNTTAGAITLTSTPTIADGIEGQSIRIVNVGTQNVVLQDQGTLAGSNLRLTNVGVSLDPRHSLELTFYSAIGDWVQTGSRITVI